MRGIYLKRFCVALIVCASVLVLALGGTSVNGAIQEVEEPAYVYTCEEGVWYKMVENETIKVITTDGESRNMVFTMQYVYEEPENPAWSFGMNILIRQQLEDGFIDIGEDIWTCRGIYMMEYDGTLYFAACVWDINEDPQTYVWWEGGKKIICMAGELDKTEFGINVRQKLYGKVEDVSAANVGKPVEQSHTGTYVYGGEYYTLSRPLLVASGPSLEMEINILDAGMEVERDDYVESDGYHWYSLLNEEGEVGGWIALDDDGHLVLQDADFTDVFALRGSDVTIHKSLNDSWVNVEEDASAFIQLSVDMEYGYMSIMRETTRIYPGEYIDGIDKEIYVDIPNAMSAYIRVLGLDDSTPDIFLSVQYPVWFEDGSQVAFCQLYRIVGRWSVPVYFSINSYDNCERLSLECEYSDFSSVIANGDGSMDVNGHRFWVDGINQLVIEETMESWEPQDEEEIIDETYAIMELEAFGADD